MNQGVCHDLHYDIRLCELVINMLRHNSHSSKGCVSHYISRP